MFTNAQSSAARPRHQALVGHKRRTAAAFAAASLLALTSAAANAATLTIEITGVAHAKGTMNVAVYDSEKNFRHTMLKGMRMRAETGTMKLAVDDLKAGDYAVMVFQDINDNEKLDSNLLGIPKEPWGGSLQGKSVFGAPGWQDVKFTLPADGHVITVELAD